jgi:CubicO group peptidase (beta-lactamase class C family)
MTNSIDGVIDAALAGKKIVGCEVTVLKDGKTVYRRAAGHFDREDGVAMPKNAIYLLASVTKPIVAAAALALVDKGVIALDDPVAKHLPYFTPTFRDEPAEITIHHLLTHTSGLAYAFPEDPSISTGLGPSELGFEENFSRVAQHPLLFAPGTGWSYSVAIDVLGALLSRVTGKSLQDVVAEHVTGPLGMRETGFFVADAARLAKPYADAEPEPVVMRDPHELLNDRDEIVRFSPSRIFSQKAFQSGGAGMAGTPDDLITFFEALRTDGGGVLSKDTLDLGMSNRIGTVHRDDAGQRFGYFGAVVEDPQAAASPAAPGAVNWGGVYGHSWLVDRASGITFLSMSNTALEGCTGKFPKAVRDAAYAEFV